MWDNGSSRGCAGPAILFFVSPLTTDVIAITTVVMLGPTNQPAPLIAAKPDGQRFGRLTVLGRAPSRGNNARVLVKCDCGSPPKTVAFRKLRIGSTVSCGCFAREGTSARSKNNFLKHGAARHGQLSPEYGSWRAMRQRCLDSKHPAFANYGAKGVRFCERWNDFRAFLADMGPRPSRGHSLDRFPDRRGNYEPGNCRWATKSEQNENRDITVMFAVGGVTRSLVAWASVAGLSIWCLRDRLKRGWSHERAVAIPSRQKKVSKI